MRNTKIQTPNFKVTPSPTPPTRQPEFLPRDRNPRYLKFGTSLVFGFWCLVFVGTVTAQPAAFTYQGRLTENGVPAGGSNDLRFVIFDAPTNGNQISTNLTLDDVPLTNGLFTVALDWGAAVFDGSERWLEVRVRPGNAGGSYTTLSPRQRLTSAPYALHSGSASNLLGVVSAGQLPANASLLGNNIDSAEIVNGTILNVDINTAANIADTKLATISTPGKVANSATTATSTNLPNTIVARDASGNFSAGTITGNFSGSGAGLTNLSLVTAAPAYTVVFTTNVSGTFGYALDAAYLVDSSPNTMKSADFNNDGRPDLIVASGFWVSVWTNDGAGHFSQSAPSISAGTRSIAVGDVNGDGKVDYVAALQGLDSLGVYTNTGSATFYYRSQPAVGDYPYDHLLADFNGDGRLDLACANRGYVDFTNTVTILTNNGAGIFTTCTTLVADYGPSKLLTAEINGDGKADLIVGHQWTNSVDVFLGFGNGTFNRVSRLHMFVTPSIALGDVDNTGRADLVATDNGSLVIFTNNGGGTLSSNTSFGLLSGGDADIETTDMNLDGRADIVALQASPNQIAVLTNAGNLTFGVASVAGVGISPSSVGANDLNADGKPDLFSANLVDDTFMVFLSTLSATNVTATFQGGFTGSALNVNGNATISGFPVVGQTLAALTNNATLIPASGYVKLAAANPVTLNATTAIANGPTVGATLILEGGSDANAVTIPNAANTRLGAARTLGIRDTLTLIWNGLNWLELSYANN